jgi:hypothetical protein
MAGHPGPVEPIDLAEPLAPDGPAAPHSASGDQVPTLAERVPGCQLPYWT